MPAATFPPKQSFFGALPSAYLVLLGVAPDDTPEKADAQKNLWFYLDKIVIYGK